MMNKALVALVLLLAACSADASVAPNAAPLDDTESTVAAEPVYEYLSHEILPCTPADGALVGPCEQGVGHIESGGSASVIFPPEPYPIRHYLDGQGATILVPHIVARATYLPNTVRCEPTRVDRAPVWTGLVDYKVETGLGMIQCFADIRVNAYIVGDGPPTLTVMVARANFFDSNKTDADIDAVIGRVEAVLRSGGAAHQFSAPAGGIEGREAVFFLAPAIDHSYEAWQSWSPWYVQRNDNGDVVAVDPDSAYWLEKGRTTGTSYRPQIEIPIETFIASVRAGHTARLAEYDGKISKDVDRYSNEDLPTLVTDANMLTSYHVEVGNTTHVDGPPVAPPPACGLAVPGHANNPGLVQDCEALLAAKDTLRGTGALNWSVDTTIADWDGIRTRGTGRVTDIILVQKSLTGAVPAELADLTALRYLWLSRNQLTGTIPPELGGLPAMISLLLNENQLTGSIPTELGNLTALESLWLHSNQLSGPVPSQLAQLSNLEKLTLSSNALTGEIPSGLGSLSNLEILWLSHNQLTGNVPSELGNLSNLQKLNLSNNQLTGAIPTSLGDLADTLTELRMSSNQFTGCVPAGLRGVAINDLDRLGLSDCTG